MVIVLSGISGNLGDDSVLPVTCGFFGFGGGFGCWFLYGSCVVEVGSLCSSAD